MTCLPCRKYTAIYFNVSLWTNIKLTARWTRTEKLKIHTWSLLRAVFASASSILWTLSQSPYHDAVFVDANKEFVNSKRNLYLQDRSSTMATSWMLPQSCVKGCSVCESRSPLPGCSIMTVLQLHRFVRPWVSDEVQLSNAATSP